MNQTQPSWSEWQKRYADLKQNAQRSQIEGPCPLCGGTDRFYVLKNLRFYCRHCLPDGNDKRRYEDILREAGFWEDREPKPQPKPRPKPQKKAPAKNRSPKPAQSDKIKVGYDYTDYDGAVVHGVLRLESVEDGVRQKTFRQWHINADGQKIPKRADYKLYPYQAALIDAHYGDDNDDPIVIVEGEKTADAVTNATGLPATTTAGGSKAAHFSDLSHLLSYDRDFVIWPDNDPPGLTYATRVRSQLIKDGTDPDRICILHPCGDTGHDAADLTPTKIKKYLKARKAIDIKSLPKETTQNANPRPSKSKVTKREVANIVGPTLIDDFCFTPSKGFDWLKWCGTHWKREPAENYLDVLNEVLSYDPSNMEMDFPFASVVEMTMRLNPKLRVRTDEWARPDHASLFNVENGTLNLEEGTLQPHDRDDRFLYAAEAAWTDTPDEDAYELWENFVESLIPDYRERDLVQAYIGYSLSALTMDHHFLLMVGAPGSGKSTFLEAVTEIMGEFCIKVTPNLFSVYKSGAHPTIMMSLMGARLAYVSEFPGNTTAAREVLNEITGDKDLRGRFIAGDEITFPRTNKLIISGNHRPNFGDTTGDGIERRILEIQIGSTVEDPDPKLPKKFSTPEGRSCILKWALHGFSLFKENGYKLPIPESVMERTRQTLKESDHLNEFLDMSVVLTDDPEDKLWQESFFAAYRKFCETLSERPKSSTAIGKALTRRGWPKSMVSRDPGSLNKMARYWPYRKMR